MTTERESFLARQSKSIHTRATAKRARLKKERAEQIEKLVREGKHREALELATKKL